MGVRRLKTLLSIAELGTFSEAAAAVHLTPAAVSQQMKSLEDEFGVPLFDRTKRPPELNPAGFALVPKARALVQAYDELTPFLTGKINTVENLFIGAVPTTITSLMPKALRALKDNYGELHIRLYPGSSDELHAQVERGFMDVAIITEPGKIYDHMHWQPFAEEPFIVFAPADSTSDDPIELLESYPFIRFSQRAWVGKMIDDWLREQKLNIRFGMELDTLEAISAMVFNNLGVSIVPMRCCPAPRTLPLKRLPLGTLIKPRVLGVLSRRDSSMQRFIGVFHQHLTQLVEAAGRVQPIYQPAFDHNAP